MTNRFRTLPKVERYRKGARKGDGRFIIVSDVYPTRATGLADLIVPSATWVEREGVFGSTERRTQHWFPAVPPPGGGNRLPRMYDGAPPEIPHDISGFPILTDRAAARATAPRTHQSSLL